MVVDEQTEAVFAWDDESAFFALLDGDPDGPRESVSEAGWYVWQIPGDRVVSEYHELRIELSIDSTEDGPVFFRVNVDDVPAHMEDLGAGEHAIVVPNRFEKGQDTKVGIRFESGQAYVIDGLSRHLLGHTKTACSSTESDLEAQRNRATGHLRERLAGFVT